MKDWISLQSIMKKTNVAMTKWNGAKYMGKLIQICFMLVPQSKLWSNMLVRRNYLVESCNKFNLKSTWKSCEETYQSIYCFFFAFFI